MTGRLLLAERASRTRWASRTGWALWTRSLRRAHRRLRRLAPPPPPPPPPPDGPLWQAPHAGADRPVPVPDRPAVPDRRGHPDRRGRLAMDRSRCAAVLGGGAMAVTIGGAGGVVAGVVAAAVLDRLLRRLEPPAARARRLAEASDLPLAADLLAAVLRGGAPVDRATAAVAQALAGPLGERLAVVARVLRLGGTPGQAWAHLAPVAGADRLVRAAVRSAEHGGALAGALQRLAGDLRADRAIAVEAAARRRGVLLALPLGLCFLPAFILAGLVPVIVAVLGDVL